MTEQFTHWHKTLPDPTRRRYNKVKQKEGWGSPVEAIIRHFPCHKIKTIKK
jgi:hypothetical protein